MNSRVCLATALMLTIGGSAMAKDLPPAVDLRSQWAAYGLSPKSQAPRGTCSVFAMVGLLEFEWARQTGKPRRLSEEFLNWASHRTNGRTADGSFFSDALKGIEEYGVCAESLLPYRQEYDPKLKPPKRALTDAATRREVRGHWIKRWNVKTGMSEAMLGRVKASLMAGHPVALGMRWPKQEAYDAAGALVVPPPDEVFDGHSIVLVGYADDPQRAGEGCFIFRNSSGPDWREGGHARLPYAYARAYGNDALGLRVGSE